MTEIIPDPIPVDTFWIAEGPIVNYEDAKLRRRYAYQCESDPIYFQWQRGLKTEQEWADKVAEINARYPYPVTPEEPV